MKTVSNVFEKHSDDILYDVFASKTVLTPVQITYAIQHMLPSLLHVTRTKQEAGMKKLYSKDDEELNEKITTLQLQVKYETWNDIYEEFVKKSNVIIAAMNAVMKQRGGTKKKRMNK